MTRLIGWRDAWTASRRELRESEGEGAPPILRLSSHRRCLWTFSTRGSWLIRGPRCDDPVDLAPARSSQSRQAQAPRACERARRSARMTNHRSCARFGYRSTPLLRHRPDVVTRRDETRPSPLGLLTITFVGLPRRQSVVFVSVPGSGLDAKGRPRPARSIQERRDRQQYRERVAERLARQRRNGACL